MDIIKTYSSVEDTAKALAVYIKIKINASSVFYMAVSGGSTPKTLFKALVAIQDDIDWSKLYLFWVDERCVDPDHDESNFKMTDDNLLSLIKIAPDHIHRMKGELCVDYGVMAYKKELDIIPKCDSIPQFDLILLGMGDDGHTASIFPSEKCLIDVNSIVSVGTNPYSGQKRITLTGKTIKNAKKIIFHVTGANKSSILADILHQRGEYLNYPAYYFRGEKTAWYVDEDALGLL